MAEEIEIKDGRDVLRKTLHARNRSPHALALIASNVDGVGVSDLENVIAGKIELPVPALQQLAKELYPHSEYDPESGLMRSANRAEPTPLCTAYPEPFDPKSAPYYFPVTAGSHIDRAPQLPKSKPRPKRQGWLGGWV